MYSAIPPTKQVCQDSVSKYMASMHALLNRYRLYNYVVIIKAVKQHGQAL